MTLFKFVFTGRRGAVPYGIALFESVLTGRRSADPYGVALLEFVLRVVEAPTPTEG